MDELPIAEVLARLRLVDGKEVWKILRDITLRKEFREVEMGVFSTGPDTSEDAEARLAAARKAVEHGYTVYLLPNPRTTRSADFIFVRKGIYRMYDLKTISGKSSAINRLMESIGQTDRVLLHMTSSYNANRLYNDINRYFNRNASAREVLIFKGRKVLSVKRRWLSLHNYGREFRRQYEK